VPVIVAVAAACGSSSAEPAIGDVDYRAEMRSLVGAIADYARTQRPGFVVIPQNGLELLTLDGDPLGPLADDYVQAIDGCGQEDVSYGYPALGDVSPATMHATLVAFLDRLETAGRQALTIDYCGDEGQADASISTAQEHGYITFPADRRELDDVPEYPAEPVGVNSDDIEALADARNFLYLINPGEFGSREEFLAAVAQTDYDLVVMDAFFDSEPLTEDDLEAIREKAGGGTRLLIAYMSIGEAEEYRYYWKPEWSDDPPSWIEQENPDWEGNYKVRYWDPAWQGILLGCEACYLDRILAAGFDGVYLDIIDAFAWFEGQAGM
jgi:cysteinyl-tRNA synthetase